MAVIDARVKVMVMVKYTYTHTLSLSSLYRYVPSNVLTTFTITSHNSASKIFIFLFDAHSHWLFSFLLFFLSSEHWFTVPGISIYSIILPHQNGLHNEKENTQRERAFCRAIICARQSTAYTRHDKQNKHNKKN